ncbi:MAG: hypothetical protein R3293_18350 [Candidatus Promineifilaceae bacterium]|nr:hypothetical protein [Candidatus Promineifilaceae bacterium]
MYYMIIAVVDEIERCTSLLDEWETVGVKGITILESTGLGRVREAAVRDDLPLMPSLRNLMQTREEHHRTLFSVVDGEEMIDRVIEATERVLGNLNEPNKGILFALPVARVHGMNYQVRE